MLIADDTRTIVSSQLHLLEIGTMTDTGIVYNVAVTEISNVDSENVRRKRAANSEPLEPGCSWGKQVNLKPEIMLLHM